MSNTHLERAKSSKIDNMAKQSIGLVLVWLSWNVNAKVLYIYTNCLHMVMILSRYTSRCLMLFLYYNLALTFDFDIIHVSMSA